MRPGLVALGMAVWFTAAPATAQTPAPAPVTTAAAHESQPAGDVRDELASLLQTYPPALREVLRLSPSLAADADYLQPYPAVAAFFAAHPEILRNPSYYLGASHLLSADAPGTQRVRVVSEMLSSAFAFLARVEFERRPDDARRDMPRETHPEASGLSSALATVRLALENARGSAA